MIEEFLLFSFLIGDRKKNSVVVYSNVTTNFLVDVMERFSQRFLDILNSIPNVLESILTKLQICY